MWEPQSGNEVEPLDSNDILLLTVKFHYIGAFIYKCVLRVTIHSIYIYFTWVFNNNLVPFHAVKFFSNSTEECKVKSKSLLPCCPFSLTRGNSYIYKKILGKGSFYKLRPDNSLLPPLIIIQNTSPSSFLFSALFLPLKVLDFWLSWQNLCLASQLFTQVSYCLDPSHSILLVWLNWKPNLSSAQNLPLVECFSSPTLAGLSGKYPSANSYMLMIPIQPYFKSLMTSSFLKLLHLLFQLTERSNSSSQRKWR